MCQAHVPYALYPIYTDSNITSFFSTLSLSLILITYIRRIVFLFIVVVVVASAILLIIILECAYECAHE